MISLIGSSGNQYSDQVFFSLRRSLFRAVLLLLAAAVLAFGTASAELAVEDTEPAAEAGSAADAEAQTVTTADGSFPALNDEGFLDQGEFVFSDEKAGIWRYCSPTLKVEILRCSTSSPKMVWYEAEVFTRGGEAFHVVPYEEDKPMKAATYPDKVARERSCVFVLNTDYAHWRIATKKKNTGIIVRNGVIYANRTVKAGTRKMPNLDVLALYADGRMEVYESDAHTGEEYLAMGVESTLAFGPILIENGEMSEAALTIYGKAKNPRTAIGMVQPGHYWAIMVEGRSRISDGANIPKLTRMMAQKGCTLAINLDGGNTSCFVFMGKQITHIGNSTTDKTKARSTAELLAVGTSSLVPGNAD